MLSNHVEDIITAIKAMPNSQWRNKALSHAYDTLAAISMAESSIISNENYNGLSEPLNGQRRKEQECICPHQGVIDVKCPVHGKSVYGNGSYGK